MENASQNTTTNMIPHIVILRWEERAFHFAAEIKPEEVGEHATEKTESAAAAKEESQAEGKAKALSNNKKKMRKLIKLHVATVNKC